MFDGDTSAVYPLHDEDSLTQLFELAYLENVIQYDANENFLATIRHEALYAAYILSCELQNPNVIFEIKTLKDLPEDISLFNEKLYHNVNVNGKLFSYGICLLNKWCGFDDVILNEIITKSQIQKLSKTIYKYFNNNSKLFYDNLYELEKKLMFFITITNNIPSLSLFEMISLVDESTYKLIQKIPSKNAYLSYVINNALIDKCIESFPQDLSLYKLFKSGSRFSKTQLARSCISIGLLADENNIIHQQPIKSSLVEGLTEEEFFNSAPGTRKG